jgi:hypothetical protein
MMKRVAPVVLLLTALALGAFLALNRPATQASPDVTITVNSTADTNARDSVMTLREAMLMATGALAVTSLSDAECDQVSGAHWDLLWCMSPVPIGPDTPETITFDTADFPHGSPATIALGSALPTLSTDDDTVNGTSAGVIVNGVSKTFHCFSITSDSNVIKGLQIRNCYDGVTITDGAQNNTIGGSGPGDRNVISGNEVGVEMFDVGTNGNVVKGNYIGTDPSGTSPLPNYQQGVLIGDGQDNTIGGTGAGEGNLIAYNEDDGVWVYGTDGTDATGNTIRGNSIHSNGDMGIVNSNGGNTELAPPTITGFGSVMGTACDNCTVDIYSDDEDEGRVYEGSTTANGAGDWSFIGSLDGPQHHRHRHRRRRQHLRVLSPGDPPRGDAHAIGYPSAHAYTYADSHRDSGCNAYPCRAHADAAVEPRLAECHLERRLHPRGGLRLRDGQVRSRLSLRRRRPGALLPRPARHLQHEPARPVRCLPHPHHPARHLHDAGGLRVGHEPHPAVGRRLAQRGVVWRRWHGSPGCLRLRGGQLHRRLSPGQRELGALLPEPSGHLQHGASEQVRRLSHPGDRARVLHHGHRTVGRSGLAAFAAGAWYARRRWRR